MRLMPGMRLRRQGARLVSLHNRWERLPSGYCAALFEVLRATHFGAQVRVVRDNPTTHRTGTEMNLSHAVLETMEVVKTEENS